MWTPWRHKALTEAAAPALAPTKPPPRLGFETDIPLGGTSLNNPGGNYPADRAEYMDQLHRAYLACPWASLAVEAVARTVTAGGLRLENDEMDLERRATPAKLPPDVARIAELLDYVNPTQDIRQLSRSSLLDLQIYGDAFIEVSWLGGYPVALYNLDCTSMSINADEHGVVSGYNQRLDGSRTASLDPHQVIHLQLDSPRGGLYGTGPVERALQPIETWLFTQAILKSTMRKGDPPTVAYDFGLETSMDDIKRWRQQYAVRNLGPANVGMPVTTQGLANLHELKTNRIAEYLATLNDCRDTIIATIGVPPRKVGIAEAGQLGGVGEGTSQDKTFRVNTCGPYAEMFCEKLTFHLVRMAFGVAGWKIAFGEVDWRDDAVVEGIRDQRLRCGAWTLNRYRFEIGEAPVAGGDDAVLVDRQNLVAWSDLPALSKATVGAAQAQGLPSAITAIPATVGKDAAPPVVGGGSGAQTPADGPAKPGEADLRPEQITERIVRSAEDEMNALTESYRLAFQRRRRAALRELPPITEPRDSAERIEP